MLGCGLSRTFTHLLVARFVTGMGSALQMSGSQLFLADISQPHNRARSLGTNHVSSHQLDALLVPFFGAMFALPQISASFASALSSLTISHISDAVTEMLHIICIRVSQARKVSQSSYARAEKGDFTDRSQGKDAFASST